MKEPVLFHNVDFQRWLLANGTREQIIEWLEWNDRNGCFSDEDAMAEMGSILSLEGAREILADSLFQRKEGY